MRQGIKKFFPKLLIIVILFCSIALVAFSSVQRVLNSAGPLDSEILILIRSGEGLDSISKKLFQSGVIASRTMFNLKARFSGSSESLKAGEYLFLPKESINSVLERIVSHDVFGRFITIPEGLTSAQILLLIDSTVGLQGRTPSNILEGSLLPETYSYNWGESRVSLLARMEAAQDNRLEELWVDRSPGLPLNSPQDAIILASIVEKETALESERNIIAGVFINRLNKRMRLQSDPTVAYGIDPTGPLRRELRRSDLLKNNKFNTYKFYGLPPGPICHPGENSIKAVLNPKQTQNLYFVADGSGGHVFAKTLASHNRNVAKWRSIKNSDKDN